jgi:Uma2 family endonuclease
MDSATTVVQVNRPTTRQLRTPDIPPLESGDRLTRAEFHRRYKAMPKTKKAELIEGVVYIPSPTRFRLHANPHAWVIGWLAIYAAATPGVEVGDNASVLLDTDNEVQPDALLMIERSLGGQAHISGADYIEGAPELIVEISASSASYDLHEKLNVYRRTGVQEYIIWTLHENALYLYRLEEGQYVPAQADEEGIVRSHIFPGLHLHGKALLEGDLSQVLATVQAGIASKEHAAFVQQL